MAVKMPSYQRQVAQAPAQPSRVVVDNSSIAPGLAQLGQGIAQLGQGLGTYQLAMEREAEKMDAAKARGVLAAIQRGRMQRLEAPLDAEGNGGILNMKGERAIAGSTDAAKGFKEFVDEQVRTLTPSQRAYADAAITEEFTQFETAMSRHVAKQGEKVQEDSLAAVLENSSANGLSALMRGDRIAFEEELGGALGEIDKVARLSGEDAKVTVARERKLKDSYYRSAVESMIAQDPAEAERLFAVYQDQMNPMEVARTKLGERVKSGSDKWHGDAIADDMIMKHGYAAAEHVESLADVAPETRGFAIDAINRKFAEADRFQDAADSEQLGVISQHISQGQGLYTIRDLEASPEFSKLGKEKAKAAAYNMVEAQRRAKSKDPKERKTQADYNAEALRNYERRLAEGREVAVGLDTDTFYDKVDAETRDRLGSMRANAKTAIEKGQADSEGEFMREVKANIPEGIDKKESGTRQDEALQWYKRRRRELGGKEVPSAEIETFLAGKVAKQKTKRVVPVLGWEFGSKEITGWEADRLRANSVVEPAPAAPAVPPSNGKVKVRDTTGKVWELPPEQVEVAKSRGGVVVQ